MKYEIRTDPQLGRLLWLSDGTTELAATLDMGLRLVHLSLCGMENLYYRQPADLSDGVSTPQGWRLLGGHRFWLAPESDASYYPESNPVAYTLHENGATLTQCVDAWLGVEKSIRLDFLPDGAILVTQQAKNVTDTPITCALWGVNTLRGGTGTVEFSAEPGGYNPRRMVSLWGQTNLGDARVRFTHDRLTVTCAPSPDYFKIGLYSATGRIVHENLGQRFVIQAQTPAMAQCADGGANVEVFLHQRFMELETLGPVCTIAPGGSERVQETWRLEKLPE